ncbi:hypothetical protein EJB05_35048, partial [Eragrostis curvula]
MIPGSAVYHVVEAMAPLYTAALLGYASVRWLKAFSDEQCSGINHFVAIYALPVLIFHTVSTNDPYHMKGRLVAADTLQKAAVLAGLTAWALVWPRLLRRRGKESDSSAAVKWVVTSFSVATLPNTIIIGVPLLHGMYGDVSGGLMKQIVVPQFCVWYNVVIFLYEFMAARPRSGPRVTAAPAAIIMSRPTTRGGVRMWNSVPSTDGGVAMVDVPLPTPAQDQSPSMMHVLVTAGKKLLKIPNTYASFLGLIWSLVAFKVGIEMPEIVSDCLFIIHTTAVGLSMFTTGTFIARQSRFVPCGYTVASISMVLKFLVGPVIMLLTSLAIGLHGTLLRVAVVQAALPLAVTSFVFAEEYKVHADIMSTGVILGIFISLPVTIVYYILLGL